MREQASKPRRVAVLTTSRADFAHLYWPLRAIRGHADLDLKLIAMGAHLSPEFGTTIDDIEAAGFAVDDRIECLLSSDTDVGMARTIGIATLSLADVLDRMRPDILLLIADRYELLAAASAALSLRIPVAHIEGGDVTEGAIDDAVRNALTKISHLHFTPTAKARLRVIAMGEEPWRVSQTGAPSLDYLTKSRLPGRDSLSRALDMDLDQPPIVVAYHPVTLLDNTLAETDAVFAALERLSAPIVFCFPNADAGSRSLIRRARKFCARIAHARLHVNLAPEVYFGLLKLAGMMIGNSSSGIMEAPSFRLPVVNIGFRQAGRERTANIIDVVPDRDAILTAVARAGDPAFRGSLVNLVNPYGDGHSAERITDVLRHAPAADTLLIKRAVPVIDTPSGPVFQHDIPDNARRA